jgi:hypothetical protein
METVVLIVVESMFGNTRRVGEILAEELGGRVSVEMVEVSRAPQVLPGSLTMLVVGGPTHVFSMTRPSTRKAAVEQGATAAPGTGIREWLATVEGVRPGLAVATFDTRIQKRFLPGSAAKAAARRLRRRAGTLAAEPETFWVKDTAGPLEEREEERVRAYATVLMSALAERGLLPGPA